MSSTTLESSQSPRDAEPRTQAVRNGASSGPGPSFLRVLNSEFIKFRTLLSTLILLGSTVVVMVGFGGPLRLGNRAVRGSGGLRPRGRQKPSLHRAGTSPSRSRPPARPLRS
jgi:hypothetical protein